MNQCDDSVPEDYSDETVKRLIQRAADAVEVGPAVPLSATSPASMPARRWPIAALAVAAAVAVGVIVIDTTWNDRPARDVTGNSPAISSTTTAPTQLPSLGRASVIDPGLAGVGLPRVILPDVASTVVPPGVLAALPGWSFAPPPGWTGASALLDGGYGSGYPWTAGFAESEDGRRSVVAFWLGSNVLPDSGGDGVVPARDGSLWPLRSLDVDGPAVLAFGHPFDGQMVLMFTGLTQAEWTSFLSSTASTSLTDAPYFVNGAVKGQADLTSLSGLPADLRSRWRTTESQSREFGLGGLQGRTYTIDILSNVAPEHLEQRAMAASPLVDDGLAPLGEPDQAVVLDAKCVPQTDTVVCGRITRSPDGDRAISDAFLSAWRDGSRIDVTAHIDPSAAPVDATSLLGEMAQVIEGLHPAG